MGEIRYLKLKVELLDLEKKVYPYFLGALIRGNFGYYLRKTVCPFKRRRNCENCIIKNKCFYYSVFETIKERDKLGKNVPHPFVIDVPFNGKDYLQDLKFSITLFGDVTNNFEYFILVFYEMAKGGLSRTRIKSKRVVIKDENEDIIFDSLDGKIVKKPEIKEFELKKAIFEAEEISINYLSPLSLYSNKKPILNPNFESIIRASLRRYIFLTRDYGQPISLNTDYIIEKSKFIELMKSDVRWLNLKRYSSRKRRKMKFGGIVGEQQFKGNFIYEHLGLLKFAEIFHIGKQASFGYGYINIKG